MAALAGFRIALWSRLAALFRQGAEFFENRREQAMPRDRSEAPDEFEKIPDRLKGVPPHWLAMVKERAPGFLHRLETFSYQLPVESGENGTPVTFVQNVDTADRKPKEPAVLGCSIPYSPGSPNRQSEKGLTRALEKSARIDPSAENVGVTKYRLCSKTSEIAHAPESAGKSRQTPSLESFRPAPADHRVEKSGGPDFNEKRRTISNKAFEQAAGQAISATKTESVTVAPKAVGARLRVEAEPSRAAAKPFEASEVSTEKPRQKPASDSSEPERDQRRAAIGAAVLTMGRDRSERKVGVLTADIQNTTSRRDRLDQGLNAATYGESVSADSFWPDLSGLEKSSTNRNPWPELPADAWSELWCRQDATNMTPARANADLSEELWNG